MPRSLDRLFHANSLRELFEGEPSEPETSLREVAATQSGFRETRTGIEEHVRAALPGDCDPKDTWFEQLSPTQGRIADMMAQAREGHRVAEEHPERGAYHGGPPIPDQGGIMQEECSMRTVGPFVPVPPDQVPPPMSGGFKMKIEPFDDYVARQRALREQEGSTPNPRSPRAVGRTVGVARGFPIIEAD